MFKGPRTGNSLADLGNKGPRTNICVHTVGKLVQHLYFFNVLNHSVKSLYIIYYLPCTVLTQFTEEGPRHGLIFHGQ